jgi:hypothetical protein
MYICKKYSAMAPIIRKIVQFAVVTPDADKTVKVLTDTLNLGPLKVWDFKYPAIFDTSINGKPQPWTMKLAFGWISTMQFEIIEPTGGNSLYREYLDTWKHAGVQHVLVDRGAVSYPRMKELLANAGMPVANEAKTNVAVKIGPFTLPPLPMFLARSMSTIFGYTSTLNSLKVVIETSKYPPGIKPRDGIRMGVPTYWSAGDRKAFEQLPSNSLITDVEGFIVLVKNINEVQPHYEKLFGSPASLNNEILHYKLESGFVSVMQPVKGSAYDKILKERGEGIQILVATPRGKEKQQNDNAFKQKGFALVNLDNAGTLYTHPDMPFQILISL